jgi:hypothetical protein
MRANRPSRRTDQQSTLRTECLINREEDAVVQGIGGGSENKGEDDNENTVDLLA